MSKGAVVLFSGGLDSTATLVLALQAGLDVYPLTVVYADNQLSELAAAARVLGSLGPRFSNLKTRRTITCKLPIKQNSQLDHPELLGTNKAAYIPGRNGVLIALAASVAQDVGAEQVWFGAAPAFAVGEDDEPFPDTSASFFEAAWDYIRYATGCWDMEIVTPVIDMPKPDIIRVIKNAGVHPLTTYSCWAGRETPCGECKPCLTRKAAFAIIDG